MGEYAANGESEIERDAKLFASKAGVMGVVVFLLLGVRVCHAGVNNSSWWAAAFFSGPEEES